MDGFSSASRRLKKHFHRGRFSAELLEARQLLSVSGPPLAGPYDVAGTHWEYAATDGSGNTATLYETAKGATTFNGNDCYDVAIGPAGASHNYEGEDGSGDIVEYGDVTVLGGGTTTDTYSPPALALPAEIEAGTPFGSTYTDSSTYTSSAGTTVDTPETDTDTITLASESTSPITVPAGTYDCYKVTDVQTDVTPDGDGTSTTDTTTDVGWYSPGVGMVKAISYNQDGSVSVEYDLSVFTSVQSQLAFTQQPTNASPGNAIQPAVRVAIEDAGGNVQTDSTDSITLSLNSNNGKGALAGTLTEPAVNGVATFSDLSIDDPGQYTITATDDAATPATPATPATSAGFTITAGKLVYLKSPPNGNVNEALSPGITVALEDSHNKIITDSDGTLVTLDPIGGTGVVPISGNTAALVGGKATFTGLTLKQVGAFTLQASDGGDTDATSKAFTIAPDKLKVVRKPATTDINTPLALSVEIVDSHGKPITAASTSVALTLNIVTGHDTATLSGVTVVRFASGVAVFTTADAAKIDASGTFTLTAVEEDASTGVLVASTTSTPITSNKFKVIGPTLTSIIGTIGTQQQTSTDDDLAITDANVFAALESNGTMSFTAKGLKPATSTVLAGINWAVVRNAADAATGVLPTITVNANKLQASVTLNAVGSFNVICYYDANNNGTYDSGEELKAFHLALVGITVKPGGTETPNSTYFNVTTMRGQTLFNSGDFVSKYALSQMETEQLLGGGADGMIGVSQIHTGFVQDGTTDDANYHYSNGTTKVERLTNGTLPIVDSSYSQAIDNANSNALFGNPLTGTRNGYDVDAITGTDPAGGQDRTVSTGDSPALGAPTTGLISADGVLDFNNYLAAYSDSFRKSFTGYLQVTWVADYDFALVAASPAAVPAWQDQGSNVNDVSSILAAPVTLDSVGFVTSGPVYIYSIGLVTSPAGH